LVHIKSKIALLWPCTPAKIKYKNIALVHQDTLKTTLQKNHPVISIMFENQVLCLSGTIGNLNINNKLGSIR
jgi:hypothetical protein